MASASREQPLQSTSAHHHHDWRAAAGEPVGGFMMLLTARYQSPPHVSTRPAGAPAGEAALDPPEPCRYKGET